MAKARLRLRQQSVSPSAPVSVPSPDLPQLPTGYGSGIQPQPPGMTYAGLPGIMQEVGQIPPQTGKVYMLTEAAEQFADWAGDKISKATPQLVKDWLQYEIGANVAALPDGLVNAMSRSVGAVQKWMDNNPEKARKAQALMTMGALAAPAVKRPLNWEEVTRPYQNIRQRRAKYTQITPKDWKGTYTYPMDWKAQQMEQVLKTVPGFDGRQASYTMPNGQVIKLPPAQGGNVIDQKNLVIADIQRSGQNLQKKLAHAPAQFSRREVSMNLRRDYNNLLKDPRYSDYRNADIDAYINDVLDVMDKHAVKGRMNANQLWKARQEIDDIFEFHAGPRRTALSMGSVDPATLIPTEREILWKQARASVHKLLEAKVPGTRKELKRMSILYSARDMMVDKAASKNIPDTALERAGELIKRAPKKVRPVVR